jgi:site-specific recombinase
MIHSWWVAHQAEFAWSIFSLLALGIVMLCVSIVTAVLNRRRR